MNIESLGKFMPDLGGLKETEKNNGAEFKNVLTDFIGDVNQKQIDANQITSDFVNGGNIEIQDVMIAGEKAKTSLDLLMEIRNKAIDMYKELERMQA